MKFMSRKKCYIVATASESRWKFFKHLVHRLIELLFITPDATRYTGGHTTPDELFGFGIDKIQY